MHKLSVKGLNLNSDRHVGLVWPWAVFKCEDVDLCAEVGMLVRLPHPRTYIGGRAQGQAGGPTQGPTEGNTGGEAQGHTQPTRAHTGGGTEGQGPTQEGWHKGTYSLW